MSDAKVVGQFVQHGATDLISDTGRVAVTIGFNSVLEDGDALRLVSSDPPISGERNALVETEQNMPLFDAHALQRLLVRLRFHQHDEILHLLLKFIGNGLQRLLYQCLEGAERTVNALLFRVSCLPGFGTRLAKAAWLAVHPGIGRAAEGTLL